MSQFLHQADMLLVSCIILIVRMEEWIFQMKWKFSNCF